MDQLNVYLFYALGDVLRDCRENLDRPVREWNSSLKAATIYLALFLKGRLIRYSLDESAPAANALIEKLRLIHTSFTEGKIEFAHELDSPGRPSTASLFAGAKDRFDQALSIELARAPIYYVAPKGVYSTRRLLQHGAAVYEHYADRLPDEAIADTNEGARCMAFGLTTAAGFHLARAVEAMMVRCMNAYGCSPTKPSQRNWGKYIEALEKAGVHSKVVHHLTQLKDLHRNPLIHPEVTLTNAEAESFWSLCVSTIQAMVAVVEAKSATPDPAIVAMLPTGS